MTIMGRTTADAVVNVLKDGRKVVNFSVAVNDRHKNKEGEKVKLTTFYNCSFWRSEKLAEHLKKGTLVQAEGRIYATPYQSKDGTQKASLNCHVARVNILAWPQDVTLIGKAVEPKTTPEDPDDLPF